VTVRLTRPMPPTAVQRYFFTTASCGMCGKVSLDQIAVHCAPLAPGPVLDRTVLEALPTTLRHAQRLFAPTGGLHACGRCAVTMQLVSQREDVGRHNAIEKRVGQMVLEAKVPLTTPVVLVSGQTSLEMMPKVAMAQVPSSVRSLHQRAWLSSWRIGSSGSAALSYDPGRILRRSR
jgi:FdhD protein